MRPFKTIKSFLRHKDFEGFLAFVETEGIYELEVGDENLLYRKAPLKWQKELLSRVQPYSESERLIFKNGNMDLILMLVEKHPVSEKNLIWGLENLDCKKLRSLVRKLPLIESDAFEIALITRRYEEAFRIWLERVDDLQPQAKELLRTGKRFKNLKQIYNRYYPLDPL